MDQSDRTGGATLPLQSRKRQILIISLLLVSSCMIVYSILRIYHEKSLGKDMLLERENGRPAFTQEELNWMRDNKEIRFAPDPNFPPIEFFDEEGKYSGLIADIFRLLTNKIPVRVSIVRYDSWNMVLMKTRERHVDGITAAQNTLERRSFLDFSKSIIDIPNVIIMRAGAQRVSGLHDLQEKRVAITENNALHEYITNNYKTIAIVPVKDDLQALQEVSFGRVDATVVNQAIATWLIRKEGIVNLKISGDSGKPNPLSIATRNDTPIIGSIMNKALAALQENEKSSIIQKWLNVEAGAISGSDLWLLILIFSSILLVVVVLTGVWNWSLRKQVQEKTLQLSEELRRRICVENEITMTLLNLRKSQEIGRVGDWSLDLETMIFTASPVALELFGFPAGAQPAFEDIVECIYHEDRERAHEVFERAIKDGLAYEIIYRVCPVNSGCDRPRTIITRAEILSDHEKNLKKIIGLNQDITERVLAEENRERLFTELEEKNRELERFTYTVSHDLKSPLITIKGFAGVLAEDVKTQDTSRIQADIGWIIEAADRMESMLDDLLELSRVGRVINELVHAPLEDIVNEAIRLISGAILSSGAEIHVQHRLPAVYVDTSRMVEVFQNLFDNAIKYASPGQVPQIYVEAEESADDQVCIRVEDNGIGIEEKHYTSIFGLFSKVDPKSEGSGVGLSLVKRIVEIHGGTIFVEKGTRLGGASFVFTVPGQRRKKN